MEIKSIKNSINIVSEPLIIAGPCSAESEEQVLSTARQLKEIGKVSVFRSGIWKPRTRPGEFEGMGSEALKWLSKVKSEVGLPVACEVATAKHVEEAIAAGIDVLWIGARTSANPFSVQEIADALEGVKIPVMIKNPVNPDLHLWIGAMERINRAGIDQIIAIHRGFSSFEKSIYRNDPMWQIAINLKTNHPEIPIIVDPSHICGNRELIQYVSQVAMDLNMQGLMIESHICPDKALTDAKQQVTPSALNEILNNLVVRKTTSENIDFVSCINQLRSHIDTIDNLLLQKLAERMALSDKIGRYKKENNVTALQLDRWENIKKNRLDVANSLNIDLDFTTKILDIIHEESIRRQTNILDSNEK